MPRWPRAAPQAARALPSACRQALDCLKINAGHSQMGVSADATIVFGRSTPETVVGSSLMLPLIGEYFDLCQVDDPREHRVLPSIHDDFMTDYDFFSAAELGRDPFPPEPRSMLRRRDDASDLTTWLCSPNRLCRPRARQPSIQMSQCDGLAGKLCKNDVIWLLV